ncbi:hypothetical protein ACFL52_00675 [Candidatus Margulisiibacteriota bacterium]
MKNILVIICILFLASWSFSAEAGMFDKVSNTVSAGYVKAGTVEVGSLSWRPDLKLGPLGLGLDVNVPLGNVRPADYESVVFRYAEYDDGQKGLRYGILDRITLGHGLLMKNYATRVALPGLSYNDQMGLKGYYNHNIFGFHAMNTWSHVYAIRLTQRVHPMLILGQSFVTDEDGVQVRQSDGTIRSFAPQGGIAVDATVPFPFGFEGYAEAAQLNNHGKAASVGIDWSTQMLGFVAAFDTGYRFVGGNFVPGYFNEEYEINPTDISSVAAQGIRRDGYFADFKAKLPKVLNLDISYENYNGGNGAIAALAESYLREDIEVSAYYQQPNFVDFNSLTLENGAVMGAKIGYYVNPFTKVITHYRKAYNPATGQVEETQFYEVALSF